METVDRRQAGAPSKLFSGHAEFDTEHVRPQGKGPAHQTILISHLFLGFPDLPRATAKQQKRQAIHAALEGAVEQAS